MNICKRARALRRKGLNSLGKGANPSVLFSLCLVTILFFGYFLLQGPFSFGVLPALTVNVTTYHGNVATADDYMVVAAIVKASGSPVSGALVTFSDSLGSAFHGSIATTNSSGVALTTVQFNSVNTGQDTINANASATGYNSGIGSAKVSVLAYGSTQLAITPSITNTVVSGGSTEVVSGNVVTVGSAWYGLTTSPVAGATVTITDTIGSAFSSATILSDNNGFFTSNFTIAKVGTSAIDLVTCSASRTSYSSSKSTIMLQVAPYSTSYLTVTMNTFFPSATSTTCNYMVIEAKVTAKGVPVSGASLTFSDSFSSAFHGSIATTNSSGVALTTVQFNSANTGIDVITASASKSGYSGGVASNIVNVLAYGSTQLAITPSITKTIVSGGSTDVVSGNVVTVGSAWYGLTTSPVAGATVTFADAFHSIFNVTSALTNSQGYFSAKFTLPYITSTSNDIIMVSASEPGYSGSSSALFIQVTPSSSRAKTLLFFNFTTNPTPPAHNVTLRGVLFYVDAGNNLSPVKNAVLNMSYSVDYGVTWKSAGNVTTTSNGLFQKIITAPAAGVYLYRLVYSGSNIYVPVTSTEFLDVR